MAIQLGVVVQHDPNLITFYIPADNGKIPLAMIQTMKKLKVNSSTM